MNHEINVRTDIPVDVDLPDVVIEADHPLDVEPVYHIWARSVDGLNAVAVRVRFDKTDSPVRVLAMLSKVVAQVARVALNTVAQRINNG